MLNRCFISRESIKLIWIHAEESVMKSCFYCKKCDKCNKYDEIRNECETKEFNSFNKEVRNWEVMYRGNGKHKHLKIKPRD